MSSSRFRIEREVMARGQETPLYRVVVRMGKNWYRTVQAGMDYAAATAMAAQYNINDADYRQQRAEAMRAPGGYKR